MSEPVKAIKILLYSDDRTVREDVRFTLGRRLASDLPELDIRDVATPDVVIRELDADPNYDVIILDGEARPMGGFGLAHQLQEEYPNCPPIALLVARVQDAWLATWSGADVIAPYPVDPMQLPQQIADLVRAKVGSDVQLA